MGSKQWGHLGNLYVNKQKWTMFCTLCKCMSLTLGGNENNVDKIVGLK
jgi:hypothetical protein